MDKFEKQPDESLDVDVDFTDWLAARTGLSAVNYTASAEAGLTIAHSRTNAVVKVINSGGTDGEDYKVTVKLTTDGATPLVREADYIMKVKAR